MFRAMPYTCPVTMSQSDPSFGKPTPMTLDQDSTGRKSELPQPEKRVDAAGGRSRTWCVKEEPAEMEQDGMVIDLTHPVIDKSPSQGLQHRTDFTYGSAVQQNLPHHLHSPGKKGSVVNENGNVPSHLQTEDNSDGSDLGKSLTEEPNKTLEMMSGTFRFSVPKSGMVSMTQPRAKREFVPESKKDDVYWNKRHKNNISARNSRMKRKTMERVMEQKLLELQEENVRLKCELEALRRMFREKLVEDLVTNPSDSPASSGLGTSVCSMSSGGSAEHSSSSSPVLSLTEEERPMKSLFQTKVKCLTKEELDLNEEGQRLSNFFGGPTGPARSPPPAHSKTFTNFSSYRFNNFLLPAHSTYMDAAPYYVPCGGAQTVGATPDVPQNLHSSETGTTPADVFASPEDPYGPPHLSYRVSKGNSSNSSSRSAGSPEGSPGLCSSPSRVTTSEDDCSTNSELRKNSGSDDQDDEPLQKMPLKFRFKSKRHSFQ